MPRPSPEPLAGAAARPDADHVGLAGPINETELPVGGEVLGFAKFVDALVSTLAAETGLLHAAHSLRILKHL